MMHLLYLEEILHVNDINEHSQLAGWIYLPNFLCMTAIRDPTSKRLEIAV